ncbi:MAG: HupE/UreJ family protein [Pseudomonadota bacterium]
MIRIVFFLTCLSLPGLAEAHSVSTRFGEVYSGLLHPITTLIHLVPWLALGILAGAQSPARARWTLGLFPLFVAMGGVAATLVSPIEAVTVINIGSLIVLGGLVILAIPLPAVVFWAAVLIFGISHGFANVDTNLDVWGLLRYLFGIAFAAYATVALMTGLSSRVMQQDPWGQTAVRAAGSWIVAIGVVFVGYNLLLP